ncbi:uncharacterized protein LOC111697769 [Eurytemora carolleeae]|uniref:uncharacterized protein LOC111697769 n=1 Tax=Eurytemora carolleeae TaxID=1294199 RepID=UPI000C76A113|nr:uncharacterized protein LOC111697769 [Eurytemora carolleeae]|eukprot:XP_023323656.1 uncharacterized protein LOC111697769 [Eurytemora affinis]
MCAADWSELYGNQYEDEKYYNDNEDDILPTIPPLPTALAAYKDSTTQQINRRWSYDGGDTDPRPETTRSNKPSFFPNLHPDSDYTYVAPGLEESGNLGTRFPSSRPDTMFSSRRISTSSSNLDTSSFNPGRWNGYSFTSVNMKPRDNLALEGDIDYTTYRYQPSSFSAESSRTATRKPRDNLALEGDIDYTTYRYQPSSFSAESSRTATRKPRDNLELKGEMDFYKQNYQHSRSALLQRPTSQRPRDNLSLNGSMQFRTDKHEYSGESVPRVKVDPRGRDTLKSAISDDRFLGKSTTRSDFQKYSIRGPEDLRAMPKWYVAPAKVTAN